MHRCILQLTLLFCVLVARTDLHIMLHYVICLFSESANYRGLRIPLLSYAE